jgi:hypothetical protein
MSAGWDWTGAFVPHQNFSIAASGSTAMSVEIKINLRPFKQELVVVPCDRSSLTDSVVNTAMKFGWKTSSIRCNKGRQQSASLSTVVFPLQCR